MTLLSPVELPIIKLQYAVADPNGQACFNPMTDVSASGCHHVLPDMVFTTHLSPLERKFVRTDEDLRNARKSSSAQLNRTSTTVVNSDFLSPNTSTARAGSCAWTSLAIRLDMASRDSVALSPSAVLSSRLGSRVRSGTWEPCLPQEHSTVIKNNVTSILFMLWSQR